MSMRQARFRFSIDQRLEGARDNAMQWLADNWLVLAIGLAAGVALFRSARTHRGCCGDTTLPESLHAPDTGETGKRKPKSA
jgi:hypothetical protein